MRYAILGDIHANLGALEAVLAAIEREGADAIVSVGDVVGYGAAPREVIQLIRELGIPVVKGNHDAACVGELDLAYFNPYAREAVEWTASVLDAADRRWLEELPLVTTLEHCQVSHGTLAHPERFDYVQCTDDAEPSLDEMARPVCFVGHTHVPVVILRLAELARTAYTLDHDVDLTSARRALINVGSVGQPRDEDCNAAYGMYDSDRRHYWLSRVQYDIASEAARIRAAGLPDVLADRLFLGV